MTRSACATLGLVLMAGACAAPAHTPIVPSPNSCSTTPSSGDPNVSSPPRCISFAGFEWVVKASPRFDPGPNAWSDSIDNVFVDSRGLHLRITNVNGSWYASEVVLNQTLGYGEYVFRVASSLERLDPNVVFGMFTYNYIDPAFGHRELDIESSPRLGFLTWKPRPLLGAAVPSVRPYSGLCTADRRSDRRSPLRVARRSRLVSEWSGAVDLHGRRCPDARRLQCAAESVAIRRTSASRRAIAGSHHLEFSALPLTKTSNQKPIESLTRKRCRRLSSAGSE
jgi:hypothetical protein